MKAFSMLALFGSAAALCPGDSPCSTNGACGANDKCTCFAGYTGEDCSQRTCNHHTSWNTIAEEATTNGGDNTGTAFNLVKHAPTECSSKGDCDRDSGECKCYEGYTGKGCRRMVCDGGSTCSGHGQCRSLADDALDNGWSAGYTGWDADMIGTCNCDAGWTGVACLDRICPVGDDPLSTGQVDTTIFLGTGHYANDGSDGTHNNGPYTDISGTTAPASGTNTNVESGADDYDVPALEFVLKYTDAYGATWSTWGISAHDTSAIAIEEALEALPNYAIPDVTVTEVKALSSTVTISMGDSSATQDVVSISKVFSIEFVHARNSGPQTLTAENSGCHTAGCAVYYIGADHTVTSAFSSPADIRQSTGSGAKIYTSSLTLASADSHAIVAVTGTKESSACSGRGSCDSEKGTCECFAGYTGNACETQTTIV